MLSWKQDKICIVFFIFHVFMDKCIRNGCGSVRGMIDNVIVGVFLYADYASLLSDNSNDLQQVDKIDCMMQWEIHTWKLMYQRARQLCLTGNMSECLKLYINGKKKKTQPKTKLEQLYKFVNLSKIFCKVRKMDREKFWVIGRKWKVCGL